MPWTYPILETMTKPNENPFVSTWFTVNQCQIVSNRLVPLVASASITTTDAVTGGSDFEVRYTLGAVPDATSNLGILGQLQPSGNSYYGLNLTDCSVGAATLRLFKASAGAFSWISDGAGIALSVGYEVGLRKSGDVLTAYINDDWASAGYQQATDSDPALAPPGKIAVVFGTSPVLTPSIYNVGGGPLPNPVTPPGGGAEQRVDRGELRGELRGRLVGTG